MLNIVIRSGKKEFDLERELGISNEDVGNEEIRTYNAYHKTLLMFRGFYGCCDYRLLYQL